MALLSRSLKSVGLVLLAAWGFFCLAMPQASASWVFVSAASDKELHVFELDDETGVLALRSSLALPGEPGALAMRSDHRLLAVALRAEGRLASVAFDPDTAEMKLLSDVPAGDDPAHLSFDPSEQCVVTAYYVAGKVSVHSIDEAGKLSQQPTQEIATARFAHAVVFDPQGQNVYVPHTGSNRIVVFGWDEQERRLMERPEQLIETSEQTGPRHAVWSRDGSRLLVDEEQANRVTAYEQKPDGSLVEAGSATTLPAEWEGSNATAEIRLHPTRDWVLVSNRGNDSIAIVDVSDQPEFVKTIATESVPRSFDITSNGRFMVVAGEATGALRVHCLEEELPDQRLEVGPRIWCVLIVE